MTHEAQVGKFFSEGSRRLWREMTKRRWTQVDLARALSKRNSGIVNRWLYGERVPTLASALLIEKVLGIKPERWNQAPKRIFVLPAARGAA
ncbi:MAG: helix-turn-helix transcriptional regulator [Polyangiaceae bacterium]|nr:helix-turn-helix transcriptional regulator [Polyangiaceae bacterium]